MPWALIPKTFDWHEIDFVTIWFLPSKSLRVRGGGDIGFRSLPLSLSVRDYVCVFACVVTVVCSNFKEDSTVKRSHIFAWVRVDKRLSSAVWFLTPQETGLPEKCDKLYIEMCLCSLMVSALESTGPTFFFLTLCTALTYIVILSTKFLLIVLLYKLKKQKKT